MYSSTVEPPRYGGQQFRRGMFFYNYGSLRVTGALYNGPLDAAQWSSEGREEGVGSSICLLLAGVVQLLCMSALSASSLGKWWRCMCH